MARLTHVFHASKIIESYHNGDGVPLDQIWTSKGTVAWTRQEIKDGVMGYVSDEKQRIATGKEHYLVRSNCFRCGGSGHYHNRYRCYYCGGSKTGSVTLTSAKSKITRSTPEYKAAKAAKRAAKKAEREAQWAKEAQDRINGNPAVLALQKAMKEDWFRSEDMNFAGELVQKFGRWGNLSSKQMAWVKKLAIKQETPDPTNVDQRILDLKEVVDQLEPKDQGFARSMINQSKTKQLSEKQMKWVVKLTKSARSLEEKRAEELRKKYLNF